MTSSDYESRYLIHSMLLGRPDLGSILFSKGLKPNPLILMVVPPQEGPEIGEWKVTSGFW